MGIEPTTLAWEAKVLPLNYIRTAIPIALPTRNAIIISLFVTNVKQNYAVRRRHFSVISFCGIDCAARRHSASRLPAAVPSATVLRSLRSRTVHLLEAT